MKGAYESDPSPRIERLRPTFGMVDLRPDVGMVGRLCLTRSPGGGHQKLHTAAVTTESQQLRSSTGVFWRGDVVGVVLVLVFLNNALLGLALGFAEVAYFAWLAKRTGRRGFSSRLFVWAAISGAAAFVAVTLLALLFGSEVPQ